RARSEDAVSPSAGVICLAKPGEKVERGQPLLELRSDRASRFAGALAALADAAKIGPEQPPTAEPVIARIGKGGQDRRMGRTRDEIGAARKVLLHDHLDGGLRPATVVELAKQIGYDRLPSENVDEVALWLQRGAHRGHLNLYLDAFQHTVAVMQTPQALTRVAAECAEDLAADGVVYGEVRFAPELHVAAGLSLDEVVEAVLEGFRAGSAGRGITVYALLTAMRTAARSLEIAELAVRFRDRGVVGFDIAGAEAGSP